MKKYLFTILTFIAFMASNLAQVSESEYATIYFYTGKLKGGRTVEVSIENQRKVTLLGNQLIIYKVFTDGDINITAKDVAYASYYGTVYLNMPNIITLNMAAGKNYFIMSEFSDLDRLLIKSDSISVTRKFKKAQLDTITRYESEDNPIRERKKKKTDITATGTGFLISTDGIVITNSHVVHDAKKIKVKITDGEMKATITAKIIYDNKATDIALLQLDSNGLKFDSIPYNFRSFGVQTGEDVFTLGYPMSTMMGIEIKLTTGILSSTTGYQGSLSSYQISVPAQPGNSGSPVFDSQGNLIGIINSKIVGLEGVTYAIKSAFVTPEIKAANIVTKMQYPISTTKIPLVNLVNSYSKFIYLIEVEE